MQKRHFHLPLIFAALASSSAGFVPSAQADEIYFDTISTRRAAREHGAYFGAFGGGSSVDEATFGGDMRGLNVEDATGWLAGIEVGYSWKTALPIRLLAEFEASYLSTAFDANGPISVLHSDVRSINLLLNGAIQLDMSEMRDRVGPFWAGFKPYFGAGIGGAYVTQSNTYFKRDGHVVDEGEKKADWTWAYDVFVGLEYAFTETFSVYGEYKRLGFADFPSGNTGDVGFDLWAVGVKVQY